MLYRVLRREGWQINHKRVERLYRQQGLSLRRREKLLQDSQPRAEQMDQIPVGTNLRVGYQGGKLNIPKSVSATVAAHANDTVNELGKRDITAPVYSTK